MCANFCISNSDRSYQRKLKFAFLQLSLLEYEDDGTLDQTSMIPMVDGGTEGIN